MLQGSFFTLHRRRVQVAMKGGMLLDCTPDSLEGLNEVTELILKMVPQGISSIAYCPTKILETVVSLNPQGITSYCG